MSESDPSPGDSYSSQYPPKPPELPRSADELLPSVEAPSAGFLLQLFFIPLVIVSIIVAVWATFSWVVRLGSNPQDLVQDIRAMNDASWQKAYTLSDLLRNPEYDYLKEDQRLAAELAELLEQEVREGPLDENHRKLRIYLSRALGEFRVTEVLPALVAAARSERDEAELAVRRTAVEGLAVLASNLGAESLRENEQVLAALLEASREREQGETGTARADLRSSAAFALGVVGGDAALDRLATMLGDPYANARYNAATGLARHGDVRAIPVLAAMLDATNPQAVEGEVTAGAQQKKRLEVLTSGISASVQLARESPPDSDLSALNEALDRLSRAEVPRAVRLQAREALLLAEQP